MSALEQSVQLREQEAASYVERLRELKAKQHAESHANRLSELKDLLEEYKTAVHEAEEHATLQTLPSSKRRAEKRYRRLVADSEALEKRILEMEKQTDEFVPHVEVYDDKLADAIVITNGIIGDCVIKETTFRLIFFLKKQEAQFMTMTKQYIEMIERCTNGEELTPIREESEMTLRTRNAINRAIESFEELGKDGFIALMRSQIALETTYMSRDIATQKKMVVQSLEREHERLERIGLSVSEAVDESRKRNTSDELKYDIRRMIRTHTLLIESFDEVLNALVSEEGEKKALNDPVRVREVLKTAKENLHAIRREVSDAIDSAWITFFYCRELKEFSNAIGRCMFCMYEPLPRDSLDPHEIKRYVENEFSEMYLNCCDLYSSSVRSFAYGDSARGDEELDQVHNALKNKF